MIAIDTNILLRYLLNDNEEQSRKARRLIKGENKVLVTDVVLVETLWTLKGKKYIGNKNQYYINSLLIRSVLNFLILTFT